MPEGFKRAAIASQVSQQQISAPSAAKRRSRGGAAQSRPATAGLSRPQTVEKTARHHVDKAEKVGLKIMIAAEREQKYDKEG